MDTTPGTDDHLREAIERAQGNANLHGRDYVVWRAPWGYSIFSARDGDESREGFMVRVAPKGSAQ